MSLKASAFERNPPTLPPTWAEFSTGIYRLDDRLLVVLDVGQAAGAGRSGLTAPRDVAHLPRGR